MNEVKKTLCCIALFFLLQGNDVYAINMPFENVTFKTIGKIAGLSCICAVSGKLIFDQLALYIEDKLVDQLLDMLVLECTPNFQLQKLPAKEREAALRKKARLINIRKRAVATLALKAKQLSTEHQKNIQRYMRSFNAVFAVVDTVRRENMYEREHTVASFIDQQLENSFVDSVILKAKPHNECSEKELQQKELSLEKKVKIAEKIKARGDKFILKHVVGLL